MGGFAAAWRPRRNGHGGEGSLPIALTILALTVIGLVPLIVLFVLP